jgi:RND family efflux transporter MFP subunit
MKTILKYVLPVFILAVAAVGAYGIFVSKPAPETRRPEYRPPLVRVQEVAAQELRFTVTSQGTVAPRTESRLVPEVSGRVLRVSPAFVAGGFFEEGDVLLEVDPYDYQQVAIQSRSRVAQARLRLAQEEAEAEVARREWEELGEGEASPLTLRQPQVEDARAALEAAEAVLEQAERDLDRTVLRAPYAGRVRKKEVDVGQYVTRGTPVATLYAVDYAEIRLPLPDGELAYLDLPLGYRGESRRQSGPEVLLWADFAGETHQWRGRIVRTEGEIDPRSRMIHAVARVENPYGRGGDLDRPPLSVGMFVEAEILGRTVEDVTVLPRAALRPGDTVWVVDGEQRLRFRKVEILRAERDQVVIRGGLEVGERVCLSPMEAVTDGMQVRVGGAGSSEG